MRYHIKSKVTGKWLAGYEWVAERWELTWEDDRARSVLVDRSQLRMLRNELKECSGFRAEWSDKRAPDGVVALGRRKVSKAGTVRFAGSTYGHDKLVSFVGNYVFVEADDYWITKPKAFRTSGCFVDGHENFICELEAVR